MASLETYRERFAEGGWEIFERALDETRNRGQNLLGVEHILHAMVAARAEYFAPLLRSLSDNPDALAMLAEIIEGRVQAAPKHEGRGVRLTAETINLLRPTLRRVRLGGRQRIEATDIFVSLILDEKSLLHELLGVLLADPEAKKKQKRDLFAVIESVAAAGGYPGMKKYRYTTGERVRIKTGPFASFTGLVEMVDEEGGVLEVRVSIMGREYPVRLGFIQVEKTGPAE